jgi:LCP family protein required for cell wall assembly
MNIDGRGAQRPTELDDDSGPSHDTDLGFDELAGKEETTPPERRRLRRTLIVVGSLVLVLALVVGGVALFLVDRYAGNVERVGDVFAGVEEDARPARGDPVEGGRDPLTFLLVGSDTRAAPEAGELPGGRSDAIMLVRFTADREHAQLISIPRDSWVEIPGRSMNKINASYAFGGPSLLIQTVEQLTQLRIDHYVAIDFEGLFQVTDDLGGVDVVLAETTSNGPYTFEAGMNHLNGEQARWYLAERKTLPGGDFDRVRRQQQYLQSMFQKLFSSDTFSSPTRLDVALRAVTSAVAVDDSLGNADMVSLAYSLRGVTPENIDFFTAPVLGTGMEGPASVVYLDGTAGERMWAYLRNDTLGQNRAEFADDALPEVPR